MQSNPYIHNLLKLTILLLFTVSVFRCTTDTEIEHPPLLPKPQHIEWQSFSVPFSSLSLSTHEDTSPVQALLEELNIPINENATTKLELKRVGEIPEAPVNQDEAYRLEVTKNRILIESVTAEGEYRALQTLRQLVLNKNGVPYLVACTIADWPAFRIRGFMHDVGRGFIPLKELKEQIALLAKFKINVFHWHLTENIAWRLESKVFPQLNDSSNFLRLPGKYYTLEEVRELTRFCKAHHVLLIPEIDMPGHSASFTRALGHDMQSPEGTQLLKLLMDEVCKVFTEVPWMHIGTDEVTFSNPEFVPEMVAFIRAKGKKVISWTPGWPYKKGEIDLLQMWSSRGKPYDDIPVIDSRLHYINHFDLFADIVGLYHSNIAEVQQGNDQLAGVIVAVWNDRYVESTEKILSENNFYPAMLTLAERSWRGGGEGYFYDQGTRMGAETSQRFKNFAEFEERMLAMKARFFQNQPFPYVQQTQVKWRITVPFPNEGDLSRSFPPEEELSSAYIYNGKRYESRLAVGAGIYLRHVWGTLIPSFYENPQPNHTAYAYTWVYSPKMQEVGLLIGFQNYGRSEKDLPPPQGKWDYKESFIRINDALVDPPTWENTHTIKSNEIPLRNENPAGRPPVKVTLKKGWNKVLLKMPVGAFTTPEVRLVKWMFTAVFVTPDGREALTDLVYSPEKILNTIQP